MVRSLLVDVEIKEGSAPEELEPEEGPGMIKDPRNSRG